METRRWTNPSQPQTLQIAVFLLYLNAVFSLLPPMPFSLFLSLLVVAAYAAGGFGVANDQNWGYAVAVGVAVIVLAGSLARLRSGVNFGLVLNLLFDVVLLALLLHPQSRDYQRIWFS